VSWDSNVATAANAEAELIGAPIPRPLCAPMKSEPDRPMTLGDAAKAELRLIVLVQELRASWPRLFPARQPPNESHEAPFKYRRLG